MKIHAFVVSWKGQHENAAHIARTISNDVDALTIVFSDPDPALAPMADCQLIRTDDTLYWADKFSTCIQQLDSANDADVMLIIHADCQSDDWALMAQRCRKAMGLSPSIALWAPLVEGANIPLSWTAALPGNDSLSPVVYVEGIVFAMTRPVVKRVQKLDYSANKFGWGIDWAINAFVFTHNMVAIVDSSTRVTHPKGSGYNGKAALSQMGPFMRQLTAQEKIYYAMASAYVKLKRPKPA